MILIYDKNATNFENYGLGPLRDVINPVVKRERNGQYFFECEYPFDGLNYEAIKEGNILKMSAGPRTKGQKFDITKVEKHGLKTMKIYAEHISYRTKRLGLKPEFGAIGDGSFALTAWKNNLVGEHNFEVWSDVSTSGTANWRVDKFQNARNVLGGVEGSILDIWGGEYEFDNEKVKLWSKMGRPSKAAIIYGKNLTDIQEETNITDTYTSIYPVAVKDKDLFTIDELYIDSEYAGNYPQRRIQVVDFSGSFDMEEEITQDKLRYQARSYIKSNRVGIPKVTMDVKFVDLAKTLDDGELKQAEEIELCDTLTILFPRIGIRDTAAKVVAMDWNPVTETVISITVGNINTSLKTTLINDLSQRIDRVEAETQDVRLAANGINKIYHSAVKPTPPKGGFLVNDQWQQPNGDHIRMYRWDGKSWVKFLDTEQFEAELNEKIDTKYRESETRLKEIEKEQALADQKLKDAGVEWQKTAAETAEQITNSAFQTAMDEVEKKIVETEKGFQTTLTEFSNGTELKNIINQEIGKATLTLSQTQIDEITGEITTAFNQQIDTALASSTTIKDIKNNITAWNQTAEVIKGEVQASKDIYKNLFPGPMKGWKGVRFSSDSDQYNYRVNDKNIGIVIKVKQNTTYTLRINNPYILNGDKQYVFYTGMSNGFGEFYPISNWTFRMINNKPIQLETGPHNNLFIDFGLIFTEDQIEAAQIQLEEGQFATNYVPPIADNAAFKSAMTMQSNSIDMALFGQAGAISRINLGANGIYLKGKTIRLDGDTVMDNAFANSLIAKTIEAGSIKANSATIANLISHNIDVNNLSGNKATFAQALFNGVNNRLRITSDGMDVMANTGYVATTFNSNGLEIYKDGTLVGELASLDSTDTSGVFVGRKSLSMVAQQNSYISWSYKKPGKSTYTRMMALDGDDGSIYLSSMLKPTSDYPGVGINLRQRIFGSDTGLGWENAAGTAGIYVSNTGSQVYIIKGNTYYRVATT